MTGQLVPSSILHTTIPNTVESCDRAYRLVGIRLRLRDGHWVNRAQNLSPGYRCMSLGKNPVMPNLPEHLYRAVIWVIVQACCFTDLKIRHRYMDALFAPAVTQ